MSLQNLLFPNDYNLYCNNITQNSSGGSSSFPAISLTNATNQIVTGQPSHLSTINFAAPVGATNTLIIPGTSDTVVCKNTADALQNKSLVNSTCSFVDSGDLTKGIGFSSSASTTATKATLSFGTSANSIYSFPDGTDTMATLTGAQTMSNKKFSNATSFGTGGIILQPGLSGQATTITAANPNSNRALAIQDVGGNCNVNLGIKTVVSINSSTGYTVLATDSGSILNFGQPQANITVTMPAVQAGLYFEVIALSTADGTHTATFVFPSGKLYGFIMGTAAAATITNVSGSTNLVFSATAANTKPGDRFRCFSAGAGGNYYVEAYSSGTLSGWSVS